jgi:hypothetical protein
MMKTWERGLAEGVGGCQRNGAGHKHGGRTDRDTLDVGRISCLAGHWVHGGCCGKITKKAPAVIARLCATGQEQRGQIHSVWPAWRSRNGHAPVAATAPRSVMGHRPRARCRMGAETEAFVLRIF